LNPENRADHLRFGKIFLPPGNNSEPAPVTSSMRLIRAVPGAALFACLLPAMAQTSATCDQTLTATLQPRSFVWIDSRPTGLEIVGTDQQTIHITCKAGENDPDGPERVLLRFTPSPSGGKLSIQGAHLAHGDNVHIKIEVPRKTSLFVRMFAGEVKVNDVAGDKDIQLFAGQITISDHQWDYRNVNASVNIGQVSAPVYNSEKGGFFRTVSRKSPTGEYRLHAHISTGEIDLRGKNEEEQNTSKPD
jgi:hypothetical protein